MLSKQRKTPALASLTAADLDALLAQRTGILATPTLAEIDARIAAIEQAARAEAAAAAAAEVEARQRAALDVASAAASALCLLLASLPELAQFDKAYADLRAVGAWAPPSISQLQSLVATIRETLATIERREAKSDPRQARLVDAQSRLEIQQALYDQLKADRNSVLLSVDGQKRVKQVKSDLERAKDQLAALERTLE
jgi:hypothetical protein